MSDEQNRRFEKAATHCDRWILVEYLQFLSQINRHWLIPIIAVLLLIGLHVMLAGSAAGAFFCPIF